MNSKFLDTHSHILMASIANAQGLTWSRDAGLVDSVTNETISEDPREIVRTLLPGYSADPLNLSVESILEYVYKRHENQPEKIEELVGAAAEILAEHGVQMPMPNEPAVHESNDTDEYFLARLRNRIVVMDMEPLFDDTGSVYKEYVTEGKLRDMNHLEDLVLEEGPSGLYKSIKILRAFAEGKAQAETTIKWDGSPAIVFGRDDSGQFFLTDKSGYQAKGYDGRAKSAKELGSMFANRKPVMDASRKQFVSSMVNIFDAYQKATPQNFRGMMSGDLMYSSTPGVEDNIYVMQPNAVRYAVATESKLGQRIGQSNTGIVVHKYIGNQFNTVQEAIKQMQGNEVFVIPPTHVQTPSGINTGPIDKLEAFANTHAAEIKTLFDPAGLKGIANIHTLFYKYINNSVDTGLESLGNDFEAWLNTENLSDSKRANIASYLEANRKGVNALWTLIRGIMKAKDWIVNEFDSHPGDVQQSIDGQQGGEGYVVKTKDGLVKLVSRHKFTAANRALHR